MLMPTRNGKFLNESLQKQQKPQPAVALEVQSEGNYSLWSSANFWPRDLIWNGLAVLY